MARSRMGSGREGWGLYSVNERVRDLPKVCITLLKVAEELSRLRSGRQEYSYGSRDRGF